MGQSLLLLLAEMGHSLPAPLSLAWPASWAWAARALKLSDREMMQGYLYSWVANQLSAAVRLLPLGPSRAQVLQQRALPLIADQAEFRSRRPGWIRKDSAGGSVVPPPA